jgi:hypothetical protein
MATKTETKAETDDRDARLARADQLHSIIDELTHPGDEAKPVQPKNPRDFVNDRMNELGPRAKKK